VSTKLQDSFQAPTAAVPALRGGRYDKAPVPFTNRLSPDVVALIGAPLSGQNGGTIPRVIEDATREKNQKE
jgi:hypothetical protein